MKIVVQDPQEIMILSPSSHKQLKLHFHQVSKQDLDKPVAFVFTYMLIRCIEAMLFGSIVCMVVFLSSALIVAFFIIKSTNKLPVTSSVVELYVHMYTLYTFGK